MNNTTTTPNLPARAGYVRKQRRYRRQVAAVKTANRGRK